MKRNHTKAKNIKQLYYSWNYNIWNKILCPNVTFIRAFSWYRLSLSISNMKLITCWLTWNKMTISPNTNTHRKWVITFLNKIRINKNISKIHYRIIYNITQLNTIIGKHEWTITIYFTVIKFIYKPNIRHQSIINSLWTRYSVLLF